MTTTQQSLGREKSSTSASVWPLTAALGRARSGLRTWVRGHMPSESQHLFWLTILVGILCGVAAVAFHLVIRVMETLFIDRAIAAPGTSWMVWTVLTPTLGGLVAGAILTWMVPGARGSGVPQVKVAYATEGGRVRFRDAIGKFVVGALQIGCGASLGREGPTVHICAGATSLLARLTGLPPRNMRRLTPVGVAAGIAAAFNAPIAAVTFTIEEIVGALDNTVLSGVVVAAALAAVIERGVLGVHPVIEVDQSFGLEHASSLVTYALLGVAAAVVSVIFTDGLLKLRRWFQTEFRLLPQWSHPAVGGLVTGVLAVVVFKTLNVTGVTGGGYDALGLALAGGLGFRVLLALCAVKIVATVFSYSSGGAGGIFAPALFVGAMLGGAFGYGDVLVFGHEHRQLGSFALVGMGAVFAGVIRAPITSVLIIFEMTGGYGLVLPLMLANMTSYALARSWRSEPVYEALLSQDGIELPRAAPRVHALERLTVADAMTSPARIVRATQTLSDAVNQLHGMSFEIAPVVNEQNELLGGVKLPELRRSAAHNPEDKVTTLIRPLHTIRAAAPLVQAVVRMTDLGVRQLCVLQERNGDGMLGMVAMSDLVRTHAKAASTNPQPAGPLVPAPELKALTLARQITPIPASTKLSELAESPRTSSCYVIRQGEGYAVLSQEEFVALTRDKDFESVLRVSDVARTAPIVQPTATLTELARLLQEANVSAAIVYNPRAQDQVGVVTREVLANALLDWFGARVSAARATRRTSRPQGGSVATL